jgi:hypothetical protein
MSSFGAFNFALSSGLFKYWSKDFGALGEEIFGAPGLPGTEDVPLAMVFEKTTPASGNFKGAKFTFGAGAGSDGFGAVKAKPVTNPTVSTTVTVVTMISF